MRPTEDEERAARAIDRLSRPGAWLDQAGASYRVRVGGDRRRRPLMLLDEATFQALAAHPGLSPRSEGGGWRLARRVAPSRAAPEPGRPGAVEGERIVVGPDGRPAARRANLGSSALAWLAGRTDAQGRPWLASREAAAADRLQTDHERAGVIGRLTMSWDAGPKGSGPRGRGAEPAEQARAVKARLALALEALAPRERAIVERVVLLQEPLQAVERHLGLPRRSSRIALKNGLTALADHYRIA